MAFQHIIMPKLKLIHGVQKSVVNPVSVIGNGTRETRRKQNRYERFVWTFPSRSILQESKQELHEFFRGVSASLDSFLFQDPDRPEMVNESFAGRKAVDTPGYEDFWYFEVDGHPLFNHPDTGQLDIKINGDTFYAEWLVFIHPTNGRPMILIPGSFAATGYSNGSVLYAMYISGPIYMTVRLNSTLSWTISAMDKSSSGATCTPTPLIVDMGDIELVEVFEHA